MKKYITMLGISLLISSSIFAQTAEEITKNLENIQIENTSLKAQNDGYDTKIKNSQKELEDLKNKIAQLNTKRKFSSEACKGISNEDLKIISGLSAGTILVSAVGTFAGGVNTAKTIATNIINQNDNATSNNSQSTQTESMGKSNATTMQKATNIASSATSAGSVITSSIALSKVDSLKNQIQKCLDSFN